MCGGAHIHQSFKSLPANLKSSIHLCTRKRNASQLIVKVMLSVGGKILTQLRHAVYFDCATF